MDSICLNIATGDLPIEYIQGILQALADARSQSTFNSLFGIVILLGSFFLQIDYQRLNSKNLLTWIMYFSVAMILLWKTPVDISLTTKKYGGSIEKNNQIKIVKGVPLGIGTIAYLGTSLSNQLHDSISQILPANPLHHHGPSSSGVLNLHKALKISIQNEKIKNSFSKFCRDCLYFDLWNERFTLQSLLDADDFLLFLSEHSSHSKYIFLNEDLTSCKQAAGNLLTSFENEEKNFEKSFTNQYKYPADTKDIDGRTLHYLFSNFKKNIFFDALLESSSSLLGGELQSQLVESGKFKSTSLEFGIYLNEWIPILLSTLELVIYAAFPIILLFSIFPRGIYLLKNYGIFLIWLKSWQPFMLIINWLLTAIVYQGLNGVSDSLSIVRMNNFKDEMNLMLALNGYILSLVPFITLFIFTKSRTEQYDDHRVNEKNKEIIDEHRGMNSNSLNHNLSLIDRDITSELSKTSNRNDQSSIAEMKRGSKNVMSEKNPGDDEKSNHSHVELYQENRMNPLKSSDQKFTSMSSDGTKNHSIEAYVQKTIDSLIIEVTQKKSLQKIDDESINNQKVFSEIDH